MGCKALGDIVSKYTNEGNSDEVMKLVKNILSSGKATDKGFYLQSWMDVLVCAIIHGAFVSSCLEIFCTNWQEALKLLKKPKRI